MLRTVLVGSQFDDTIRNMSAVANRFYPHVMPLHYEMGGTIALFGFAVVALTDR